MSLTDKQLESIQLILTGLSQIEIGRKLDVTPKTLQRWQKLPEYQAALNASKAESSDKLEESLCKTTINEKNFFYERALLRQQEYEYLEAARIAIMPEVVKGNLRAIDCLIKLSRRKSDLLGMDYRNYPLLDALQITVSEGILTGEQLEAVINCTTRLEDELKNISYKKNEMKN